MTEQSHIYRGTRVLVIPAGLAAAGYLAVNFILGNVMDKEMLMRRNGT